MTQHSTRESVLVAIKVLHTAVWLFFVGCIAAIPITAAQSNLRWAAILTGLVLIECAVLAFNRCRCPLTGIAARYTEDRRANFDIYLPVWVAHYNKEIFGTLFVLGVVFVLARWLDS